MLLRRTVAAKARATALPRLQVSIAPATSAVTSSLSAPAPVTSSAYHSLSLSSSLLLRDGTCAHGGLRQHRWLRLTRTPARLQSNSSGDGGVINHPDVPQTNVLRGQCGCGAVGWQGVGSSSVNFICHCSICRAASDKPFLAAAGFKPENIKWINKEGMEERLPENSKNKRYYCRSCKDYVAEDATRVLGVFGLPLDRAQGDIDPSYMPNHHIFYANRVREVPDGLPKWATLMDGSLVKSSATAPTSASTAEKGVKPVAIADGSVESEHGKWNAATGILAKNVTVISPTRGPEPLVYHFTETDAPVNNVTYIAPEKVQERVTKKYYASPGEYKAPAAGKVKKRDVIIIGGGHNSLVTANYLAMKGLDVLVLERRHVVGGAAVTEEIFPGFKFSRASYLAGLLRPQIIKDLDLPKYGFKYLPRDPSSITPTLRHSIHQGKTLLLGRDDQKTWDSVAQFSKKDADALPKYEDFLGSCREIISPILDGPPPDPTEGNMKERMDTAKQLMELLKRSVKYRKDVIPFYELFTAPASHILDRWFESDVLKATLATDAVIGANVSPKGAGSAYVLLHHVMGEAAGAKGVWAYVQGGMGMITQSMAASAKEKGVEIVTNATVKQIVYEKSTSSSTPAKATGVMMQDGSVLNAKVIVSNATPYHTFLELLPGLSRDSGNAKEDSPLPEDFVHHIRFADYSCGAMKINCAVDRLPEFDCMPNNSDGSPGPQHMGTVHFEDKVEDIENAFREASMGVPASRPVIEMTIPSALDRTISPPGKHVVQFFIQFMPYDIDPKKGSWADERFKSQCADRIFAIVDEYCPGFSQSVIGRDILSPLDLERVFGLHKGNIMHGALSLHQLAYARPAPGFSRHRTPLQGLYLAGAGAHPGGGVMGAAGRNCANIILSDLKL